MTPPSRQPDSTQQLRGVGDNSPTRTIPPVDIAPPKQRPLRDVLPRPHETRQAQRRVELAGEATRQRYELGILRYRHSRELAYTVMAWTGVVLVMLAGGGAIALAVHLLTSIR